MDHATQQQQPLSAVLPHLPVTGATLAYTKDLGKFKTEAPYRWRGPLARENAHLRSNVELEIIDDIPVRDVSDILASSQPPSLARNGFEIARYSDMEDNALADTENLERFLAAVANLVKERARAEFVVCFNFAFRRCDQSMLGDPEQSLRQEEPLGSHKAPNFPGWQVHSDYTVGFAKGFLRQFLKPEEADKYLTDRYRIWLVNAWKPLYTAVKNAPLGFCDPATVSAGDEIEIDLPSETGMSRTTYYKYSPRHEWYWCRNQSPTQVSLFKSWDSDPGGSWPCVPHVALNFPSDVSDKTLRDSVESRMIVVMDKNRLRL